MKKVKSFYQSFVWDCAEIFGTVLLGVTRPEYIQAVATAWRENRGGFFTKKLGGIYIHVGFSGEKTWVIGATSGPDEDGYPTRLCPICGEALRGDASHYESPQEEGGEGHFYCPSLMMDED